MSAPAFDGDAQGSELKPAEPMLRADSSSVLRSEVRESSDFISSDSAPKIYQLKATRLLRPIPKLDASEYSANVIYHSDTDALTAAVLARGEAAPGAAAGLSNDHIRSLVLGLNKKPAQIELWRGGSLIKCSREKKCQPLPPVKRGEVLGFSRKSRGRMIATQAKIRWRTDHLPFFMGNTCPDKVPAADHVIASWGRFCRRYQRRFPKGALLWRKEIKDRQSGTCAGEWVPHYHSFAYNCPRKFDYQEERGKWVKVLFNETNGWTIEIYCLNESGKKVLHLREQLGFNVQDRLTEWWSRNWYEAMGSGEIKHYKSGASFQRIEKAEGVRHYTSKYMAKVEVASASPHCKGRWWGIVSRGNIPWAERVVIAVTDREAITIMRACRQYVLKKAKRKFRCNHQAMNYLVTDPCQWERYIAYVLAMRNVPF